MKFRTEINIPESASQFSYADKLFFIGSCFTKNIGTKLSDLKFQTELNPFGVLYNPISIKNSINILLKEKTFSEKNLQFYNDLWFSFSHHSSFSHSDQNKCLQQINGRIETASAFLKKSNFLFITFGTSYIYQWKKTKEVVSNCHKLPAKEFTRRMVPSCEIFDEYIMLINDLRKINPTVKIILTLSPVRHLKDGFAENMHSKANLLIAIHQLVDFCENVTYFPAYEIMMDDLRDYRFYNDDMIHLNDIAINYIWEKFRNVYIDKKEFAVMTKVNEIMNASQHKPFNPNTDQHKKFVRAQLDKIKEVQQQCMEIDLEKERSYFTHFLKENGN